MTIFHSIILGIIEGITEFLPISSTGHLILASSLLHITENDFTKSFDIIIQLGAILAVVFVYWKKLWNWERIKKLIVAFIPTGIIGLTLYKIVKSYLIGNTTVVLWSLFIGGIVLMVFEYFHVKKYPVTAVQNDAEPTYKQAFIIGLFQSLAIIPGVSRSAASIVGGLSLGLSRIRIVEFSFLLAVPTMIAASGLDIVKNHALFSADQALVLVVGFIVSFAVALASIKFLLRFIKTRTFFAFGVYRVLLAIAFWLFFV
jgi:undecaprenyl-diphosphatase